jgi:hypothetical protein
MTTIKTFLHLAGGLSLQGSLWVSLLLFYKS